MAHSWADRGECGGEVVYGPCERCTRVSDGDGDEFHPSPILVEGRDEWGVLLGLLRDFFCRILGPGLPENPISMRMRVHVLLSKLVWPGSGVSGTPLAYMRSGAVPWPPSKRACVSSIGNTHGGARLGADVHSAS